MLETTLKENPFRNLSSFPQVPDVCVSTKGENIDNM